MGYIELAPINMINILSIEFPMVERVRLNRVVGAFFLLILFPIPTNLPDLLPEVENNIVLSEVGDTAASVTFSISLGNKSYHAAIEGTELFRELTPLMTFSNTTYWGEKMEIWFRNPDGRHVGNSYRGGVNEEGLALSMHEVPALPMNAYDEFDDWVNMDYIPMNECVSVDDVIAYHNSTNYRIWGDCMPRQMHYTDSTGDAVVASAGDDGDPVFTRIEEHYLVSTNFNLNNPENRYGEYPCERYQTCVDMLSDIQTEEELTLEAIQDVLEAACVPERSLYSYIYESTERMLYFFFPYNFSQMISFDMKEEVGELGSLVQYNITQLFENCTIPANASAPITTPFGDWSYSTPEQQGMDSEKLQRMMRSLNQHHYCVDSVIVARNGRIVFEESLSGFSVTSTHSMWSVSKSVTSTLFGIAYDLGYIESLDQHLLDFFPDREIANLDGRKENITLRDLLTMTPGYEWNEWAYPYEDERNICTLTWTSPDPIQYILDLPMIAEPGEVWGYNSGATILLGEIIKKATGMDLIAFASKHLFIPLGIGELHWNMFKGVVVAEGGLSLTARDAARFGYLIQNNGSWKGNQIVSSDWIADATSVKKDLTGLVSMDPIRSYGYQWWLQYNEDYFCALGRDCQAICIHPELNLVMVATALDDSINWPLYFQGYVVDAVTGDPLPTTTIGPSLLPTTSTQTSISITTSILETTTYSSTTPVQPGLDIGLLTISFSVGVTLTVLAIFMLKRKK